MWSSAASARARSLVLGGVCCTLWSCAASDAAAGAGGAAGSAGAAPDDWLLEVTRDTPRLAPDAHSGCLTPSGETVASGSILHVLAGDSRYALIDESGAAVELSNTELVQRPDPPPAPARVGVVRVDTQRYHYDENGCPAPGAELSEGDETVAVARSAGDNYRGFVVVDHDFGLVKVRELDAEGWSYPWHAGVQLVKEVPQGFVVGGGVVIDATHILTAAHLSVDDTWCYSREPNSGVAWDAGLFSCDNVVGPARKHSLVDVAVVELIRPLPPPYAKLRGSPLATAQSFYSARYGMLLRHVFADASVHKVGGDNANCAPWPVGSSFTSDPVVGPGDSGGPAWVGDELVGLVHGERCSTFPGVPEHVFVHVPGILDFIRGSP